MSSTPPGWYPAPDSTAQERYWDGARWTPATRPAVVAQQLPMEAWARSTRSAHWASRLEYWALLAPILVGVAVFVVILIILAG